MAINNRYDEVVDGATNFQKEGDSRVRSVKSYRQVEANLEAVYRDMYRQVKSPPPSPTDKTKAHRRQSTETRTHKSTMESTVKSIQNSTEKLTKIRLQPPIESAPMKSTRWSPKRTSNDDYRVTQHVQVNATYL
jgi:hypothetical protein